MNPAIGGALISGGLDLVGGIFGRKDEREQRMEQYAMQRRHAKEDYNVSFKNLRKAAVKGGFNPLTALQGAGNQSGNGQSFGGGVPLASTSLVQGVLSDAADYFRSSPEREEAQARTDLMKLQVEKMRAELDSGAIQATPGAATPVRTVRNVTPPPLTTSVTGAPSVSARPPVHPAVRGNQPFPILNPDGSRGTIRKATAARLNLKPWDIIIGEDEEAVLGDGVQQTVGMPSAADRLGRDFPDRAAGTIVNEFAAPPAISNVPEGIPYDPLSTSPNAAPPPMDREPRKPHNGDLLLEPEDLPEDRRVLLPFQRQRRTPMRLDIYK